MKTVEYDISTGEKQDFYTLWKTVTVDLRPRDKDGNVTCEFKKNAKGGNMYYHVHIIFVQNLGKTKELALAKLNELGIAITPLIQRTMDFDLKHLVKPSFEAFGVTMKYNNGKWYAKATSEFFECWKANKETMKENGWGCWKYKDLQTGQETWYMGVRVTENTTI